MLARAPQQHGADAQARDELITSHHWPSHFMGDAQSRFINAVCLRAYPNCRRTRAAHTCTPRHVAWLVTSLLHATSKWSLLQAAGQGKRPLFPSLAIYLVVHAFSPSDVRVQARTRPSVSAFVMIARRDVLL